MADLELVNRLLQADHLAFVAVARPDGTVHGSLVSAGVLEHPVSGEPSVGVVVGGGSHKLRLFHDRGRATALIKDGFRWVSVEGPVHFIGPDDPHPAAPPVADVIRSVFTVAGGTHDNWDEFDRVMAAERRCAVFISVDRIQTNG